MANCLFITISCSEDDADMDGFTESQGDCDDENASIYPGAPEICGNGIDEDCNGVDLSCSDVDQDGDGASADVDCDDSNAAVYPGAPEICSNGIDEDCDGRDLLCSEVDQDGDGVTADIDCDDNNAAINPNVEEICGNGIDEDCDGQDLDCPVERIIPGQSVDGFVVGDDYLTQIEKSGLPIEEFGVATTMLPDSSFSHFVFVGETGIVFLSLSDVEDVFLEDTVFAIIVIDPYDGTTVSGIGLNSLLSDARAAYGTPDFVDDDGSLDYLFTLGIWFVSDEATQSIVDEIWVTEPINNAINHYTSNRTLRQIRALPQANSIKPWQIRNSLNGNRR